MVLSTKLKHLKSKSEIEETIKEGNVMICCGRMGPMCLPVYGSMEAIENDYANVQFRDMLFDSPDASFIKDLPECQTFQGLPFTVYYKDGKVVEATTSIQTKDQIKSILDRHFS